jgi:dTDP-4-amino-4,6-dideoxygalactose transaminase
MDPDKIINCITSKTCAIVPVHIFGQPCQVKEIEVIAKKYGLRVIYDAAHSFGTKVNNIPIGNFGDISMFSFHATKMFHTVEGGCLTFAEPLLKSRIDALKNFGLDTETGLVAMLGLNGKLSEVHAAIGLEVLELVNKEIQDRKNFFHMYLNELKNIDGIKLPFLDESVTYNYQYFGIQINKEKFKFTRDDVSKQLASYDIYTKKYFEPCNNFPDYKHFPTSQQVPITNKVASETLVLPLHGRLREEDIIFICNTIKTMR